MHALFFSQATWYGNGLCILLFVLQIASNKPAPFITTNPSITILQRDCQIRLSVSYSSYTRHRNVMYHRKVDFVSFLLPQVFSANLNVLFILNIIEYIFFFQYFHWHRYIGTCIRNHKESRLRSHFSYPPAFRMHHQALKMKDGWRIKAIPKCQASAMATSVAKTERLRR